MHQAKDRRRRAARIALGVGTTAGLAASMLVNVPTASAAVAVFPNNVVVFPDRDFVSIEGYSAHKGETATLTVTRGGTVMGSAKAVVSGTDVAFEVNHPGGVCWGAGTTMDVTPDIQAGDVVSISFPDGSQDETTTSSATVSKDMTLNGSTLTVEGTVGPEVNRDFIEQRIINPDLVDTDVAKRDIRALPGPLTPAARGGYSSGLEYLAGTDKFVATYVFDDPATAEIAAAADLGERAMNWQVQDPDGNRQGLTIAEFGEAGGPGMGGCPQGPGNQAAPAGTASAVRPASDKTTATVKWTPVAPQPGADAVTGYSIEAINTATQSVTGVRLGTAATQTTLTGLDATAEYTFEVRSQAGLKMSVPFTMGGAADTTLPTVALTPAGGASLATAVERNSVDVASNGQVFFTTDGSPAILGDAPSDNAQLLAAGASIPITAPTELNVAAFDQAGNHVEASGFYKPVTVALPGTPGGLAGTATQNSVALTWNAVTGADGYQVKVYDALGVALAAQPPVTSVANQTVTGLNPNTTYLFSVAAKNAAGSSAESTKLTKKTDVLTDRVSITSARWKAGDFRVVGTGSQVGATVTVLRVNADGSQGAAIAGASAAVVAAAPPGIGDFSIRLRTNVPTGNPGRIFVKSSGGGIAGPFTVANG